MCWHKWSKWKVISAGDTEQLRDMLTGIRLAKEERSVNGKFEIQRRKCEKCAKCQLRQEMT